MDDDEFEKSEELERFLANIESRKFLYFAIRYFKENEQEIENAINGVYEEKRKSHNVPKRKYEILDFSWRSTKDSKDVIKFAEENMNEIRLDNLKRQVELYGHTATSLPKNQFYKDLKEKCPVDITLPNGKKVNICDIVKVMRNVIEHPESNDEKKKMKNLTGSDDPASFLSTTVYVYSDGSNKKIMSYHCAPPKYIDNSENEGTISLIDVIEHEYIPMIIMYDNIRVCHEFSMDDIVEKNLWRPYEVYWKKNKEQ